MSWRSLIEGIQQIAGTKTYDFMNIIECTVVTVDISTRSCACKSITGRSDVDYPQVRLMAEVEDGGLIEPMEGSTVIVAYSKRITPFVQQYSQIKKASMTTGETVFSQDDAGFVLETKDESLKKIMTDLVTGITKLTATNSGGTTNPINNISTFNDILKRIPKLLS